MSEARTKMEFLYKDTLGDIHDLVSRVEDIKKGVPDTVAEAVQRLETSADAAASKLKTHSDSYVIAARNIQRAMLDLARRVDEYSNTSNKAAGEVAKAEIREAAKEAASRAIAAAVGTDVGNAVRAIDKAADLLVERAGSAKLEITQACSVLSMSFVRLAGLVVCTSLLTSLTVVGVLKLTSAPTTELSQENQKALATGKALINAWPALSPKEQTRIREVLQPQGGKHD